MQFTVASALRFFDDLFKIMGPKPDAHCKLNDAEIATVAVIAALSFYGNQAAACGYMQRHYGMKMIHKSGFSRRLHRLQTKLTAVFRALGATLKELNTSARYRIDRTGGPVFSSSRLPELSNSSL